MAWEVFRWLRSGPKLEVSASPYMQYITPGVDIDEMVYINVTVTNAGDKPTTLTHFCGRTYRNWFDRVRGKPEKAFVVNTGPESPIPHKLAVGERWSAMTKQDKAVELPGNSLLYIGVQHAMQSKPNLKRVHISRGNG